MRNPIVVGSMKLLAAACLLVSFGLLASVAAAQTPAPTTSGAVAPPAPFQDWQAFLAASARLNGLSSDGSGNDLLPWHLKVSFKLLDDQGKVKDEGIFEELQASPTRFKVTYSSKGFTQTTYGTDRPDRAVWISGANGSGQPWPISVLWSAFVSPLPPVRELASVDLEARASQGAVPKMTCIDLKTRPTMASDFKAPVLSSYCFNAGTTDFRSALVPVSSTGTLIFRSNLTRFQGRSLPLDVQIGKGKALALTAHLETVEVMDKIADAEFTQPADARLYPTMAMPSGSGPPFFEGNRTQQKDISGIAMVADNAEQVRAAAGKDLGKDDVILPSVVASGLVLNKVQPTYPPIAKAARIEGTVVLMAIINKAGAVESLKVVSGHPMLQQAALDAVKQWTYKPYVLHGKPVEVATTVNVVFQLDSGIKPRKIMVSAGVARGQLITPVAPIYPPEAKAAKVSGTVLLRATIGRDGLIKDLQVISGPPMLQQASLDAVKQWQYRPYLLNGEPVEVETAINVVFNLGNAPPPPKQP